MTKLEAELLQFENAIQRLDDVLKEKRSDIVRDSAIKRFEICMDLAWKTLKTKLEEENNVIVHSPNNAFREAYKQGYIDYDEAWIAYMKMRNDTVHTYKEAFANATYAKLSDVLSHLKQLLKKLKKPPNQ